MLLLEKMQLIPHPLKQTHYRVEDFSHNSSLFQPLSTSVEEHLGIAAYVPITP